MTKVLIEKKEKKDSLWYLILPLFDIPTSFEILIIPQ